MQIGPVVNRQVLVDFVKNMIVHLVLTGFIL